MTNSKPGPGSYGGGRSTDHAAAEDGGSANPADATLGNGSSGAEKPPVPADYKMGWSTDQLRPSQGPRAEKEEQE